MVATILKHKGNGVFTTISDKSLRWRRPQHGSTPPSLGCLIHKEKATQ
jgi:hypothetical protein